MNVIAERLKTFRLQENLNQEGVARVAGMKQNTWAGWEKEPPSALESVVALARHYGVSADYLLALTDDPTPRGDDADPMLNDLVLLARKLPGRRKRDLLAIARLYAEQSREMQQDPALLVDEILKMMEELDGTVVRDHAIDLLEHSRATGLLPPAHSEDKKKV